MIRYAFAAFALVLAAGQAVSLGQDAAPPEAATLSEMASIADRLARSMVVVEYAVQYDKGDAPGESNPWAAYYAQWYRAAGMEAPGGDDWDQCIREERPAERAGYLIAPNRVLTADPLLHPRFIKSIAVRVGERLIAAEPVAYGADRGAMVLELAEPAADREPLKFDTSKPGPYQTASYRSQEGVWSVHVGAGPRTVSVAPGGQRIARGAAEALLLAQDGTPVGFSMNGSMGLDDTWKGSPADWPNLSADEAGKRLAALKEQSDRHLLRVEMSFRSPRSEGTDMYSQYASYYGTGESEEMTEWNGTGVLLDDRTLLVLANLKPKVTARLEGLRIHSPDGGAVEAEFAGSLADYGAVLATLQEPLQGAARFASQPVTELRDRLLLKAEIGVLGEVRTAYYHWDRIGSYSVGWRRQVTPDVAAVSGAGGNPYDRGQNASLNFLYTLDGELVAVPLSRRPKVAVQEDERWGASADAVQVPVSYLREALADRDGSIDPENRPLSEDEESRLAWLGVELQPMDPDLARVNGVVDETNGGQAGAIVTYIYPGSPAEGAELQVGDILLRLHIDGQPKPLDVQIEGAGDYGGMFDQFWAMLDQIPEEYFDRMPAPWGSAENALTRALTDIGFGKPFVAELVRNGEVISTPLAIVEGPAHYGSARRLKSESTGLTVRELTYEVRRYFQLEPDAPGVIISKIERGSKASVAGLRPFEIVLAVNDAPVHTVAEFEQSIAAGGDLRLNVKRMTEGRIVKMEVEPSTAAKPAEGER